MPAVLDGVFLDPRADGGRGVAADFAELGDERSGFHTAPLGIELVGETHLDFAFQRAVAAVVGQELGANGEVDLRRLIAAPEDEHPAVFGGCLAEFLRGLQGIGAEEVVTRTGGFELDGEGDFVEGVVQSALVDEVLRLRLEGGRGAAELRERGGHVALGDEDGDAKGVDEDEEDGGARGEGFIALDEQPELPAEARVFGARGKAALIRGEVGLQLLDGLVAVFAAHRQRLHGDGVQRVGHASAGQVRLAFRGLGRRARPGLRAAFPRAEDSLHGRDGPGGFDLLQNLVRGRAVEGKLEREDGVKDRAEGEDIAARIERADLPAGLLGRHKAGRAHDRAAGRGVGISRAARALDEGGFHIHLAARTAVFGRADGPHEFGDAPVHDEHLAVARDHHVLRLEVAVEHALAVRESDGVADFLENGEQLGERIFSHGLGDALAEKLEDFQQGDALHQLHRVEKFPLRIQPQLMHGHDVRVLELAGDLRLLDEAPQVVGLAFREHDFHRHGAADGRLARIENRAHAALRDHRPHVVFFAAEKLIRQHFRERRRGRGTFPRLRNLQREHAELRSDAGRQEGEFGDGCAVDKGAVAGAEIFEKDLVHLDDEPRMLARNEIGNDVEIGLVPAADDVRAGSQLAAKNLFAVAHEQDLCFGGGHNRARGDARPSGSVKRAGRQVRASRRGAHASRVVAEASSPRRTLAGRVCGRGALAGGGVFIPARAPPAPTPPQSAFRRGRRNQHAGRVCSPEPPARALCALPRPRDSFASLRHETPPAPRHFLRCRPRLCPRREIHRRHARRAVESRARFQNRAAEIRDAARGLVGLDGGG